MNWNLEDLKRKRMIIKGKLSREKNEEKIKYLCYELNALETMINYISSERGERVHEYIDFGLEDAKKAKIDFLEANLPFLTSKLDFLTCTTSLPHYFTRDKRIETQEFYDLFEKFLSEFKFGLGKIFEELESKRAINLSNKYFYEKTCIGVTYYLPTFAFSYIDALFNNKITSTSCLPHELAHAYQFDKTGNRQSKIMSHSVLNEAFPYFVELAFFDFLKYTKYFKNAINMERTFMDSLYLLYEFYGSKYIDAKNLKFVNEEYLTTSTNQMFSEMVASRFISKLLAYYFIDIYRNKQNGVEIISDFNEMFRQNQEYLFFDNFGNENIINALKAEFENYYRDIKSKKTFELNRKL